MDAQPAVDVARRELVGARPAKVALRASLSVRVRVEPKSLAQVATRTRDGDGAEVLVFAAAADEQVCAEQEERADEPPEPTPLSPVPAARRSGNLLFGAVDELEVRVESLAIAEEGQQGAAVSASSSSSSRFSYEQFVNFVVGEVKRQTGDGSARMAGDDM